MKKRSKIALTLGLIASTIGYNLMSKESPVEQIRNLAQIVKNNPPSEAEMIAIENSIGFQKGDWEKVYTGQIPKRVTLDGVNYFLIYTDVNKNGKVDSGDHLYVEARGVKLLNGVIATQKFEDANLDGMRIPRTAYEKRLLKQEKISGSPDHRQDQAEVDRFNPFCIVNKVLPAKTTSNLPNRLQMKIADYVGVTGESPGWYPEQEELANKEYLKQVRKLNKHFGR